MLRALLASCVISALAGCSHETARSPASSSDPCEGVVCESTACLSRACVDGACVDTPVAGACDDDDPCTEGDACTAGGACLGEPVLCLPRSACEEAIECAPHAGCAYRAAADGTACDDGDPCTKADACLDGACGGQRPSCPTGVRDAPAPSCRAILLAGQGSGDGTYRLSTPSGDAVDAFCDMTTDGGAWARVRTLDVPASIAAPWRSPVDVPYRFDLRDPPRHERVLVKLTLDDRVRWVSFPAGSFSPYLNLGDAIQGEIPGGRAGGDGDPGHDVNLRIQSWPHCYGPPPALGVYGWGNLASSGGPCYGTFAFFDGETPLFAFDRWASGGPVDLGIGAGTLGQLDWTFAGNGGAYRTRRLEWFVGSTGPGPDPCHGGPGCDPESGSCAFPALADGTACDDGDACSTGDACLAGACVPGASRCGRVEHVLVTGQSLSTGAVSAVLSLVQPFGNLAFGTGVRAGATGLGTLVPLTERWNGSEGETIASALANSTWSLSDDPVPMLVSAHGIGGQPYSVLKKGTAAYASGLAQIAAGRDLVQARGRAYELTAVMVVHGESDHLANNPLYASNLEEWQRDYERDAAALLGRSGALPMFLCQMSSHAILGQATSIIPGLQLAAARAHPDRIFLVAPKYFLPYSDGLHLTGEGERWLGEYHAKAYRRVVREGKPWVPLQPRAISREGAVITVNFDVPAPPLVFDTDAVADPGNLGFDFTDGSGAPPTIASVRLTGPGQVQIGLSAVPAGPGRRLRYAFTGVPGARSGPRTGARGNLRDSDATPSLHGDSLANWCVHFDEPVP